MKRILILCVWVTVSTGCKDLRYHAKDTFKIPPLHSIATISRNVEPIAILKLHEFYHFIYSTSNEATRSNSNAISQSISKDLINWSESSNLVFQPYKNLVLRGGIIIDSNNITGYGTNQNPPLVAVLARIEYKDSINQEMKKGVPILAFSTDEGNSWTEAADKINFPDAFTNNPQNISIFWYQPTKKWIMSLALNDHAEFYSSPNLRSWNFESLVGADFFPEDINWKRTTLFLSNDKIHWALLVDIKKSGKHLNEKGTVYFIGYFDGHSFVNQSSQLHWLDYGDDIYQNLTYIEGSSRRINVAWRYYDEEHLLKTNNNTSVITTFPRELNIENTNSEWFITASPLQELKKIPNEGFKLESVDVSYKIKDLQLISNIKLPVEIFLKFNTSNIQKGNFPTRFGVIFLNSQGRYLTFGFDRFGYYYLDKSGLVPLRTQTLNEESIEMPFDHSDSTMSFHFIVDFSTIQCFTERGKLVMTRAYALNEPFNTLKVFSVNGNIKLIAGKVIGL